MSNQLEFTYSQEESSSLVNLLTKQERIIDNNNNTLFQSDDYNEERFRLDAALISYNEQSSSLSQDDLTQREENARIFNQIASKLPENFRVQAMVNFYESEVESFDKTKTAELDKQEPLDLKDPDKNEPYFNL